ncbi:MAG: DNA mismatch repair endonuclease MutL, partial [Thermoguttaceae bacterium]
MPIHRLPTSLVNKIAAGEVIERPASVVKELMENAVDAGATRIDVSVAQGGLDLVRVVDNGGGIAADELPLALAPHATSKLGDADDLFRVGTLGFRGEALASIAEVSRLVLRSRTPQSQGGAEIEANGGALGEPAPCGCPVGTTIEVHNLFFNTPVRRKFLRTTATEFGHVSEAFTRIALATPHVHFTLRHNDRQVFALPAESTWLDRIAVFFGRELADNLIWVESDEDGIGLSGYAAHPSQSRSHNRMQYFFLNGRHIRDRALQHALT